MADNRRSWGIQHMGTPGATRKPTAEGRCATTTERFTARGGISHVEVCEGKLTVRWSDGAEHITEVCASWLETRTPSHPGTIPDPPFHGGS